MIKSLSILIPCFNSTCFELVKTLQLQAYLLCKNPQIGLQYEIIVADDGSTDSSIIKANSQINSIENCSYILRKENSGRAIIRNFLAKSSKNEWLLFIDSDMIVNSQDYLSRYVKTENDEITYGGYIIPKDKKELKSNLRYLYEKKNDKNSSAKKRQEDPFKDFHTSNFLIRRDLMLEYPLDNRFKQYGYEDVLFGKTLQINNKKILHIDNPVSFEKFEENSAFIAKTEEAMMTLASFKEDLKGYSSLIDIEENLNRFYLLPLIRFSFKVAKKVIKKNLTGNKPSVFLFNIYKLGTYCCLKKTL